MLRRVLLALCITTFTSMAFAEGADFSINCVTDPGSCQADFDSIVEDASTALNFKNLGPAEATGLTGVGVALFLAYAPTENPEAWKRITGSEVDAVVMPGLMVRKGLPFNIDIGAFYAGVPGAKADLFGAEIRYAILEGGVASPALAVRATYVGTSGFDDFNYRSYGGDVSISKGFAILTPYLGAGYTSSKADPKNSARTAGLDTVTINRERVFAGVRIGLALLDIIPEYERVGSNNSYNLLLGLSF
ncbi:MAG TPA: hypothetical protein VM074_04510 [Solimonas sp.]|nr:hypothetical protein [Solimonas sp.]